MNQISLLVLRLYFGGMMLFAHGWPKLMSFSQKAAVFPDPLGVGSELSLVLEGSYPLLRWLPNYLHYNYDGSPLRQITRTMMVCRLEAPTFELTRGLIDKAISVG